jgi:hypothetical protein
MADNRATLYQRLIGGLLGENVRGMDEEQRRSLTGQATSRAIQGLLMGQGLLGGIGGLRTERQGQRAQNLQDFAANQALRASGDLTQAVLEGRRPMTAEETAPDASGLALMRGPRDLARMAATPESQQALLANPELRKAVLGMAPQPPEPIKPTTDITNFMFGASNPEFLQFLENTNRAKAQNIKINTGESGELAAQKTIAEAEAKMLSDQQKAATSAARSWKAAQGLIDISSKPGAVSGALAPGIVGANNFLVSIFGRGVSTEDMADAQTFQAAVSRLFIEQMGALGGARGLSESESLIIYAALPQIATSPQARISIARLIQSKAEENIEDYNQSYSNFREAFGNIKTGLKPVQKPSVIDEGRFQQWLNSPAGQTEMQNLIRGQQSR